MQGFGGGFLDNDLTFKVIHHLVVHAAAEVILGVHPGSLGLEPKIDVFGNQGYFLARMRVSHPHGGGKDAVVLDVVAEEVLELRGEGVIGLQLDITQFFSKRNAARTKGLLVRELVDFPHEGPRIETEGVVTLLEFVQFLNDGNGDHNVVVLKLPHALVVVQDDVGVQYKNFGHSVFSLQILRFAQDDKGCSG